MEYMRADNVSIKENARPDHHGTCVELRLWLNAYPRKPGVTDTMNPRTSITELMIDYNKHNKLQFGEYVQTHKLHKNRTGTARTIGALSLSPKRNDQGGKRFYSLRTVRMINYIHCTPSPIPNDVISRIHALAQNDSM